jgi:hypothetical protein
MERMREYTRYTTAVMAVGAMAAVAAGGPVSAKALVEPLDIDRIVFYYPDIPGGDPISDVMRDEMPTISRAGASRLQRETGQLADGFITHTAGSLVVPQGVSLATVCSPEARVELHQSLLDARHTVMNTEVRRTDLPVFVMQRSETAECAGEKDEAGANALLYTRSIVVFKADELTEGSFAHEYGHASQGSVHNSQCEAPGEKGRVDLTESCTRTKEYGDPFTLMGGNQVPDDKDPFTAAELYRLGIITDDQVHSVTKSGKQQLQLQALKEVCGGIKIVRIPLQRQHDTGANAVYIEASSDDNPSPRLGVKAYLVDETALRKPWFKKTYLLPPNLGSGANALLAEDISKTVTYKISAADTVSVTLAGITPGVDGASGSVDLDIQRS